MGFPGRLSLALLEIGNTKALPSGGALFSFGCIFRWMVMPSAVLCFCVLNPAASNRLPLPLRLLPFPLADSSLSGSRTFRQGPGCRRKVDTSCNMPSVSPPFSLVCSCADCALCPHPFSRLEWLEVPLPALSSMFPGGRECHSRVEFIAVLMPLYPLQILARRLHPPFSCLMPLFHLAHLLLFIRLLNIWLFVVV